MGSHDARGVVLISRHDDAFRRAQVQVPEHVAGRERGHEHIFGVVAARVAEEGGVRRAPDGRLARAVDFVIARVGFVCGRAPAQVASPGDARRIGVFGGHGSPRIGRSGSCVLISQGSDGRTEARLNRAHFPAFAVMSLRQNPRMMGKPPGASGRNRISEKFDKIAKNSKN